MYTLFDVQNGMEITTGAIMLSHLLYMSQAYPVNVTMSDPPSLVTQHSTLAPTQNSDEPHLSAYDFSAHQSIIAPSQQPSSSGVSAKTSMVTATTQYSNEPQPSSSAVGTQDFTIATTQSLVELYSSLDGNGATATTHYSNEPQSSSSAIGTQDFTIATTQTLVELQSSLDGNGATVKTHYSNEPQSSSSAVGTQDFTIATTQSLVELQSSLDGNGATVTTHYSNEPQSSSSAVGTQDFTIATTQSLVELQSSLDGNGAQHSTIHVTYNSIHLQPRAQHSTFAATQNSIEVQPSSNGDSAQNSSTVATTILLTSNAGTQTATRHYTATTTEKLGHSTHTALFVSSQNVLLPSNSESALIVSRTDLFFTNGSILQVVTSSSKAISPSESSEIITVSQILNATGRFTNGTITEVLDLEEIQWILICSLFTFFGFVVATLIYCRDVWMTSKLRLCYKKKREESQKQEEEETKQMVARDNISAIPKEHFLREFKKREAKGYLKLEYEIFQANNIDTPNRVRGRSSTRQLRYIKEGNIEGIYIDGYLRKKKFLAISGLTRTCIDDFWSCVWVQNVQAIVMLAGLSSYGEQMAVRYWPERVNGTCAFGKINVRLLRQVIYTDYYVNRLLIYKVNSNDCRIVTQFMLRSLPMDGAAAEEWLRCTLVTFRRIINRSTSRANAPIIIHGSPSYNATFIACDFALTQLEEQKNIAIFYTVMSMMANTPKTIFCLTLDDYMAIYKTAALSIRCGNTAIEADNLASVCYNLTYNDSKTGVTGYADEFKEIQKLTPVLTIGDCASGFRDENRLKNRNTVMTPPDRARPYLITRESRTTTDYINAVYIQDFRERDAFIVTEWPQKDTINDLWRMIYDMKVSAIVVLNRVENMTSWGHPKFWPFMIQEPATYGALHVKLTSSKRTRHIQTRVFDVQKKKCFVGDYGKFGQYAKIVKNLEKSYDRLSKKVTMYQFVGWNQLSSHPAAMTSLLELVKVIHHTRRREDKRPICVLSKDGFSGCGVFCTSAITHDQLTSEKEVDIFNTVRAIKLNRPELVPTKREYALSYDIALAMTNATKADVGATHGGSTNRLAASSASLPTSSPNSSLATS